MVEMKGTSWQQRYKASEIFTLRFRIKDEPEIFAGLMTGVAQMGANISEIKLAGIEKEYKIQDITFYLKDKKQFEKLLTTVNNVSGVEVVNVSNDILEMHRRGAIEIVSRVPIRSLTDLRILYTPGVAMACQEIEKDPTTKWQWTGLCDRVAVITNGTAVLGLGDIGVVPSLPVMEGKAAIFAEFAQYRQLSHSR